MAQSIKIKLDTDKYQTPTEDDIKATKQYILQRENYADILGSRIDEILADAAERIVSICYRYNVEPRRFTISSEYNSDMMDEIAEVMDEIEDEIYDLILEYSTRAVDDDDQISMLAAWIALLGKGQRNLRDTLHMYLLKFLKDLEAAIAALRYMGVGQTEAISKVLSYLHNIYMMPEVLTAIRKRGEFAATYIFLGGVQPGAVGISNNGSTNVVNMAKTTLQMAWMRAQGMKWQKEDGVAGFYVLRGSTYDCDWCDSYVGFHPIEDLNAYPPIHPHCKCFVIPIFAKQ